MSENVDQGLQESCMDWDSWLTAGWDETADTGNDW